MDIISSCNRIYFNNNSFYYDSYGGYGNKKNNSTYSNTLGIFGDSLFCFWNLAESGYSRDSNNLRKESCLKYIKYAMKI